MSQSLPNQKRIQTFSGMFQYVPFCKRRVRVCLCSLVLVIIWTLLRKHSIFTTLQFFLHDKQPVLIPNIVHFFHFIDQQKSSNYKHDSNNGVDDLSFVSATCILAAAFNQQPEKIIIHTNTNLTLNLADRKYWSLVFRILNQKQIKQNDAGTTKKVIKPLKQLNTTLEVAYLKQPTHVFGQPLSSAFHATDVARLNLLLSEGGIALDQDSFIIRKLDPSFFNQKTKVTLGNNLKNLFQHFCRY